LLKLAVDAQLPVIAVRTTDMINFKDVVKHVTGKSPQLYDPGKAVKHVAGGLWYFIPIKGTPMPYTQIYHAMVQHESSLIVINPDDLQDVMFDAGEMPVPKDMMHEFMKHVTTSAEQATKLMRGLGGCTIKEAAELARLTMARDMSLTVDGLMKTRKMAFQGSNGLTQVDTTQDFYQPAKALDAWLKTERNFFLNGGDHRLRPRGLLFDGPPGTGKTAGAKHVAHTLGVPLFRLDIAATKNKYVGQSEANLTANLAKLDQEEPCVVLIDEVEKIFGVGEHSDAGTTTTMLSQLLWWLAEHRSRVLTIMTTNAASKLPKELHREGRIDETMYFGGLHWNLAVPFVRDVAKTFKQKISDDEVLAMLTDLWKDAGAQALMSQAKLTEAVYRWVKKQSQG
jgi:hypothetical protein